MKQSKVSFPEEQDRFHEAQQDLDPMLQQIGNQSLQDSAEIHIMEAFIQNKYSQVADLQQYLVKELQEIENSKSRNKRIEKLLVTNAIPTLQDIKSTVLSIKQAFQPFCYLAVNYIQAISEKCRCLLEQKEESIKRYQAQVDNLRQEVRLLKEQTQKKYKNIRSDTNIVIENNLPAKRQGIIQLENFKQEFVVFPTISPLKTTQSNSISRIDQPFSDKILSPFNISNKSKSKSPIKPNKYQQCYRNILQNKKVNINYRCDRSPTFENFSPMKGIKNTPKATTDGLKERKDYIKMKIEKIKSKADNRECWFEGSGKGRLK